MIVYCSTLVLLSVVCCVVFVIDDDVTCGVFADLVPQLRHRLSV